MTIIFRARSDLLNAVRGDLHRLHPFAAERVGWLVCRAGRLVDGGLVILASGYDAIADEDYVDDPSVGAMMGPTAIRKALVHVHMHGHRGRTGFSEVDDREPEVRTRLL